MSRRYGCESSAYCKASLPLDALRTHTASQHHRYAPFVCRAVQCASGGPPAFPTRAAFVSHMAHVHQAGGAPVPFIYKEKARKERAAAADVNRAIAAAVRRADHRGDDTAGGGGSSHMDVDHSPSSGADRGSRMSPDTTREDVVDVAEVPLSLPNVEPEAADRRWHSPRLAGTGAAQCNVKPAVSPLETVETCGAGRPPAALRSAIERASTHRNVRAKATTSAASSSTPHVRRSNRPSKSSSRSSSVARATATATAATHDTGYDIDEVRRIYYNESANSAPTVPPIDAEQWPDWTGIYPMVELLACGRKTATLVDEPRGQFKESERCATCGHRRPLCVCHRAFPEDGPI